jgi:hypothetical protein
MEAYYQVGRLTVSSPHDWTDVTAELGHPGAPLTLVRPHGVGALQFSMASYEAGEKPEINAEVLTSLMSDFARSRKLTSLNQRVTANERLLITNQDFTDGLKFLRIWNCSDGLNIALGTYTCAQDQQSSEIAECETIVKSLRFVP